VFVNFSANPDTLAQYLGDLPRHFERWPLERRYTAAHVSKRLACNWKIVIEAFLETFHVAGIHPQSLPFLGDVNSQYDVWPDQPHYSRMINPSGVPSPQLGPNVSQQRVLDAAAEFGLCTPRPLAEGEAAREHIVACLRTMNEQRLGIDLSAYSDSEAVDVIQYYVFPNFVPFGGFGSPLVYRTRPDGDDPHHSIFEVWLLLPYAEGVMPPEAAPLRVLSESENFADVEALSYFGPILDQDAELMPRVQQGLRSSARGVITLGNYQESRIRHMRETLDKYLRD
jgi:phenylpropionate dioxygenase-like ring-hydroxylating dioxygenase large terminal subunit